MVSTSLIASSVVVIGRKTVYDSHTVVVDTLRRKKRSDESADNHEDVLSGPWDPRSVHGRLRWTLVSVSTALAEVHSAASNHSREAAAASAQAPNENHRGRQASVMGCSTSA
jgi:hypothetical protein